VIRHAGSVTPRRGEDSCNSNAVPAPSGGCGDNEDVEPINYSSSDIGTPNPVAPMEVLALTGNMIKILTDIKFWHSHKEWYRERDINWRRGYMLYGRPGSGKSSLVRAVAEEFDLPVHVFDLSTMNNADFHEAWTKSRQSSPRIVLIEDVDATFHGRENTQKNDLSFDTLLNTIDGIERENGLLLFVTTNHIDKIDPALGIPDKDGKSSRPGRIDLACEIGDLDFDGRFKIAMRILRDNNEAINVAMATDGDTGAQVQERAIKTALQQLWGE
jgi:SpoVK/Ycf46/Vps4 family AAA+-type ATPase